MAKISNKKLEKKEEKVISFDTLIPLIHSILLCFHDLMKNIKILA